MGVAYKQDIGDLRESSALDIIYLLQEKGARVSYHDPYRFAKAGEYLVFAQNLAVNEPLYQPQIISRCYYAMYHAARALVLHIRRADVDDHERLLVVLGQALGVNYRDVLNRWREMRNRVDYSPYLPADMADQSVAALQEAEVLLAACRDCLRNRGVKL